MMPLKEDLERKVGPLPVWAWAVAGGGGIVVIVVMRRRSTAASTAANTSTSNVGSAAQPIVGTPSGYTELDPTDASLLGQLSSQLQTMQNNAVTTPSTTPPAWYSTPPSWYTNGGSTSNNPTQPVGNWPTPTFPWPTTGNGSGAHYVGSPAGDNNNSSSALTARNSIGDNAIVAYFQQFKLPSWIGLQFVAENARLPNSPAELTNWLNSHGYRDPSTGTFTTAVSSATVPPNVQSELNAAYGS